KHGYGAYVFALMLFCEHIGTALPAEMFMGMHSGVDFIEQSFPDMDELVFHSAPPPPVSFLTDTGIEIGHFTWQQAATQLANPRPVQYSEEEEDRIWDTQAVQQYYEWLTLAVQTQSGIVTFFS